MIVQIKPNEEKIKRTCRKESKSFAELYYRLPVFPAKTPTKTNQTWQMKKQAKG